MSDNTLKKLGVWIIVGLFAAYVASVILVIVLTEVPTWGVVTYAAVMLIILIALAYEGWERIKEIDGGLEDAVDNY